MAIMASVGQGGKNHFGDVKQVQQLLQRNGFPQIRDDGRIGPKTIQAIKDFQSRFMARPDGVIDANGKSYSYLIRGNAPGRVAPPARSTPPANTPATSGTLTVSAGQVTFDAEGGDNPSRNNFSRHIHCPSDDSGVTIGRGYDLKMRSESSIISDLTQAGVPLAQAQQIAKSHGKSGAAAKAFVRDNRAAIGTITHQMQVRLFELIYPRYVETAHHFYDLRTANIPQRPTWENLKPAVRALTVDFVYQGFKSENTMKKCMSNDIDTLINYIETTPELSQYEGGRNRVGFLKRNR